jgi:perosamine synthetase
MSTLKFPTPKIPPSALLESLSNSTQKLSGIPSILDIQNRIFTTSGRASIALALKHAGITKEDEVLVPAYHCEAMVAPAKWRQAKVVFYRINPDTSAQFEDISAKITSKTRAIIVTHYFGFEQPLQNIKALCEKHNMILIEDCAHAMFGISSGKNIGTTGDYAIGSCMKFLPIYEGGMLCSAKRNLNDITLSSPSLKFQLKSVINTLEDSVNYKRLGGFGKTAKLFLKAKDELWNHLKIAHIGYDGNSLGPSSSEGGFGLDEAWIYKKISWFSRKIIEQSALGNVTKQRRNNYLTMFSTLTNLPNCRVLFATFPEHTVPWVFPVYVEQPEKYFLPLKMQGVPVWRFGEFLDKAVTKETCSVSVEYSKHIFQFPCHQSLTTDEIDWMLKKITAIFTEQS